MSNDQEQLQQQYLAGKEDELREIEEIRKRLPEVSEEDYIAAIRKYRAKINLWFEEWDPQLTKYAAGLMATAGVGATWGGGPVSVLVGGVVGGSIGLAAAKILLSGRRLAARDGMITFPQEDGRVSLKLAPDNEVIASIKKHITPNETGEYTRQIKSSDADDFKNLFNNVCDNVSKKSKVGKFTIGFAMTNLFAALNLGTTNDIPATADLKSLGEYHALEEIRESEEVTLIKLELVVKATETTAKCCWMFCQGKKDITFTIRYKKWTFENYTKFQETYRRQRDTNVQTEQTTTQDES